MKQSEIAFVEKFVEQRKKEINAQYESDIEQAKHRADLEVKTFENVHRYEFIQGDPRSVLMKFQEKVALGYQMISAYEQFSIECLPNFLSIPLVVPAKKLQKEAEEIRAKIMRELIAAADERKAKALDAVGSEALAALEAERARVLQRDTAAEIRRLMGEVENG
ncbi:hypothetical protein ACOS7Q_24945 [Escherichia coli]|uniref:hypothetical protein n=1 Tax=Escherichia coli TaxID=562 RepID=UPI003B9BFF22